MGGSSTKTLINQHAEGGASTVNLGDAAIAKAADTPVQTALKSVSKIIESGSELIAAPVNWIKDMQQNWSTYMITAIIAFLAITFLYCATRLYFNRKGNSASMGKLLKFASIFPNNNGTTQGPLPLLISKLSSAESSTIP